MKEVQDEVRAAAMRRFERFAAADAARYAPVQAGRDADGSVRREGAEAVSAAFHAGKS